MHICVDEENAITNEKSNVVQPQRSKEVQSCVLYHRNKKNI